MEKSNFAVNGGMKLPIGYRFHPTDEELLVHYLRRKISALPLPAYVIPELDVFEVDPWNLPGDLTEKRYFFGRKWGNEGENRSKIVAGCGYWKPIGKRRPIITSLTNHIIGTRKTLIFCREKQRSPNFKIQWMMHEYHLIGSGAILPHTTQVSEMKFGEWVVHRIFQRKRRPKMQNIINSKSSSHTKFMESTVDENFNGASPCSSGITEVSTSELDQEEISSYL